MTAKTVSIWSTQYRYQVLSKEVGVRLRELIRQTCDSQDIQIIKGGVSKDHVHRSLSSTALLSVSELVRRIKGRSSRKLQEEFRQLGKRY